MECDQDHFLQVPDVVYRFRPANPEAIHAPWEEISNDNLCLLQFAHSTEGATLSPPWQREGSPHGMLSKGNSARQR